MPTVSERQTLIERVQCTGAEVISYHSAMNLDSLFDGDNSGDSEDLLTVSSQLQISSASESESSSSSDSFDLSDSSTSSSDTSSDSSDSTGYSSDDISSTDEEYMAGLLATSDILWVITATRVLYPHQVSKVSQLNLILINFKWYDPKHFRYNLRVSPDTFDSLQKMIEGHTIFSNNSYSPQSPVSAQLATALFRFGHNGNAASVEAVAQQVGVSAGTVVNWMRRVMIAFLALHNVAIRWPSEEEKEVAKEWVESVSCNAWRDGFCMVDGTPAVLFQKPGYHGEAYFDRKSNYLLNVQVSTAVNYTYMH